MKEDVHNVHDNCCSTSLGMPVQCPVVVRCCYTRCWTNVTRTHTLHTRKTAYRQTDAHTNSLCHSRTYIQTLTHTHLFAIPYRCHTVLIYTPATTLLTLLTIYTSTKPTKQQISTINDCPTQVYNNKHWL